VSTTPLVSIELIAFKTSLEREGKADKTVHAYVTDVREFLNWCDANGKHPQAGAVDFLNACKSASYANATIGRYRSSIKAYFRLNHNIDPIGSYKVPPPPDGQAHPLPELMDDLRKMLAVTDGQVRVAIALQGYAGLRIDEARSLKISDIDQASNDLVVMGKGSKVRRVPISPELFGILQLHILSMTEPSDDSHLISISDRGIRYAITRAGLDAGVSRPVSSHDLRMTFGTVVYGLTKDIRLTQELLGHKSPTTTARYTGISEEAKRDAVKAMVTA
jgi:integrase/recombinase XerC